MRTQKLIFAIAVLTVSMFSTLSQGGAVNFRWAGAATNALGTALPAGSLVLTYLSQDATVDWSSTWVDGTDNGNYGARNDDALYVDWARGNTIAGTYNTPAMATNNYSGYYAYAVVFDYSFSSFGSGLIDGTDYGITPSPQVLPAWTMGPANIIQGGRVYTTSDLTIVPEPTTFALLATGMGVVLMRRRKKQTGESEQSA